MLLPQLVQFSGVFALTDILSGIGFTEGQVSVVEMSTSELVIWMHFVVSRAMQGTEHTTCVGQVLLFTSYKGNLDNQLRCEHQPKREVWLSAQSHCGYASQSLHRLASAIGNPLHALIEDTFHGLSMATFHGLAALSMALMWSIVPQSTSTPWP